MQDPVAALRIAQAGVRKEGNDNASEIAGNLDMAGILTPKVSALRNEFDTIIDYALPGDVAGFRQQLVQFGEQPEDVNALSGFLLRLTTLRTDVVSSCSGQIRGEADRLVVDMRNRGRLGEQEMRQYEERAQFRSGVRPDREQSPQTLQTAIEGLLWLREQALRLPPL